MGSVNSDAWYMVPVSGHWYHNRYGYPIISSELSAWLECHDLKAQLVLFVAGLRLRFDNEADAALYRLTFGANVDDDWRHDYG